MNHKEEIFGTVYERGSVVFRQGDTGEAMYVIQSGAVEISQMQAHREVVIALLEKGDFFGEMALIDTQPRSCTVTAIGRTRLLALTRHSLLERLRRLEEKLDFLHRERLDVEEVLSWGWLVLVHAVLFQ